MTGRIGGRSNVAHEPLPVAVFPPLDVAVEVGGGARYDLTGLATGVGLSAATAPGGSTATTGAAASSAADGNGYAVAVVSVCDLFAGSTAFTVTSPTLTGRGITWALLDGPYAGFKSAAFGGSVDLYETVMLFAGYGSLAPGTMTVDLGATNARALSIRVDNMSFSNVDSLVRSDSEFGASAGITASAELTGAIVGMPIAVLHAAGDQTFSGTYVNTPTNQVQAGGVTSGLLFMYGTRAVPMSQPVSLASVGQNYVWVGELYAVWP